MTREVNAGGKDPLGVTIHCGALCAGPDLLAGRVKNPGLITSMRPANHRGERRASVSVEVNAGQALEQFRGERRVGTEKERSVMATRTVKITIELKVQEVPKGGFKGRFGHHLDMHWREPELIVMRQIHEAMIAEGVVLDGHMKPANGKADVVRYIVQELGKAVRRAFKQKTKKSKTPTYADPD